MYYIKCNEEITIVFSRSCYQRPINHYFGSIVFLNCCFVTTTRTHNNSRSVLRPQNVRNYFNNNFQKPLTRILYKFVHFHRGVTAKKPPNVRNINSSLTPQSLCRNDKYSAHWTNPSLSRILFVFVCFRMKYYVGITTVYNRSCCQNPINQ